LLLSLVQTLRKGNPLCPLANPQHQRKGHTPKSRRSAPHNNTMLNNNTPLIHGLYIMDMDNIYTCIQEIAPEVIISAEELKRQRVHYLGVVDEVEGVRGSLRKQCLQLMQKHIEHQLIALRAKSESLRRAMARRERRIRVSIYSSIMD